MKRILFILFCLSPFISKSQHFEAGLMVGASAYQGDLTPDRLVTSIGETHVAFGGFLKYNINDWFAARFGVNYGSVSGDDSKSKDPSRMTRNLSFKSSITEFSLIGEWNIIGYQPYNLSRPFSPYLFGGIALFKFNPKAELNGDWIALQPLGTEGQGLSQVDVDPYKLTQFAIPFGLGVKYAINDTWNIGLEAGSRFTFTDYIDDVSGFYVNEAELREGNGETAAILANRSGTPRLTGDGRGDPTNDDWYLFGGITISYNFLDNGLVGFRNRNGRKSGCPTF